MSEFPLGHRKTLWIHNSQKKILIWIHKEGPLPMSEIYDRLNNDPASSPQLSVIALMDLMGDGGILIADNERRVDYA